MAPNIFFGIISLLIGSAVSMPPYHIDEPVDGCCYGRATFENGQTVTALPQCCASLVCHNGNIQPRHFGPPGSTGCCEFDGQMYPDGARLSGYCVPLVCYRGAWTYSHEIEECCKMCRVYNDPHIVTYDGYLYHWHGLCNYTITQTDRTDYPQVGVFSDFRPCFNNLGASCLHITTFKNDESTLLTLQHTPGSVTSVGINRHGVSSTYIVPPNGVHAVQSQSSFHPVLAWRDGNCIFLAGSSRIVIRHCPNQLKVWAYPTHTDSLDGLCGHFNFYQNDDMTNKNGTVHALHQWPLAFPESWKTQHQNDLACMAPCRYCKETTDDPCQATPREMTLLKHRCAKHLHPIIGRDQEINYHVDTCAWDVCMAVQAKLSLADQDFWINEAKIIVRDVKMIRAITSGTSKPGLAPSTGVCSPGSRWKQECNWCTCASHATVECTEMACPAEYEHEVGTDACVDGSWWKSDSCNWCECLRGGQVCTHDECNGVTTATASSLPTSPTEEVCLYNVDSGSCQQFEYRYYYSLQDGKCIIFRYNGCGGNPNNFMTLHECQNTCGHLTTLSTSPATTQPSTRPVYCNIQPNKGPCKAFSVRYFLNSTTNTCQLFVYGGCEGNENNFESRQRCEESCGTTTQGFSTTPVFNFTILPEPTVPSLPAHCSLRPDHGHCNNSTTRYYFNPQTNSCKTFTYGGCGGNLNNFLSEHWCLASCHKFAPNTATSTTAYATLPDKCYQEKMVGTCFDGLWRWYYNQKKHICEVFVYNGCNGNDNNFLTPEECNAACGGQTQSITESSTTASTAYPNNVCFQSKEVGPCTGAYKRYYYDYQSGSCLPFYYSGCGGNSNNFHTMSDCQHRCDY